jgi:hypothetical protein
MVTEVIFFLRLCLEPLPKWDEKQLYRGQPRTTNDPLVVNVSAQSLWPATFSLDGWGSWDEKV